MTTRGETGPSAPAEGRRPLDMPGMPPGQVINLSETMKGKSGNRPQTTLIAAVAATQWPRRLPAEAKSG